MARPIVGSALSIMRRTRSMLMPKYGNVEELSRKDDHAHSAVTKLDLAVEDFLERELRFSDRSITFVGEENGGDRKATRKWLCDPIDGTAHYVRGRPYCTVMLALIEDELVTFGAIYDFVNDIMYHAEKGMGAFENGESIRVSDHSAKDAYLFAEMRRDVLECWNAFTKLDASYALMNTLSSGHEHAMVACGKMDGRVNFKPYGKDYDYAAGGLLVAEAGGIVANLGGSSYDYRNLDYIAANPKVFEALTKGPNALFPIV